MAADNPVYKDLRFDHELSRPYRKGSGEIVQLYIGYYAYQEQGREIIGYRTDAFHRNASRIKMSLNPHGTIEINRLIQHEDKRKKLVLFWYDLNGRVVADQFIAKAYTAWDSLRRNRTNGAIVVLTSDFHTDEDLSRTLAASQGFIQKIRPLLSDYFPAD
jgi:EpsI family protein